MIANLKNAFDRYVSFTDQEWENIARHVVIKKYAENERLLEHGKVCNYVGFVVKGIARYYFFHKDKEIIVQFFTENCFFSDYKSFLLRAPSIFYIEALEECEVLMIYKEDIEKLYVTIPNFEKFGRIMAENLYLSITDKTIRLLANTPEEKFAKLINEHPELFRRVPQYMLSSYLGVTPEAFCRIKKRFFTNKTKVYA